MRYRELTLAFVVVALMATLLAFSGAETIDAPRSRDTGITAARGYLGLIPGSVDDGSAGGALVRDVLAGSPADRAGIRPGDLIHSVDGRPVRDGIDLHLRVAETRPGTTVELGIDRDARTLVVTTVELGARPRPVTHFGLRVEETAA